MGEPDGNVVVDSVASLDARDLSDESNRRRRDLKASGCKTDGVSW